MDYGRSSPLSDTDMLDEERPPPTCTEDLLPGAILVQYRVESGPLLARGYPCDEVGDKLEAMGEYSYLWQTETTLTYEIVPKTPFYRERLLNPFRQKIGPRSYHRSTVDAKTFFAKQQKFQSKEKQPVPEKSSTTPRKRNRETSPSVSASSTEEPRHPPLKKTDQGKTDLPIDTPQIAKTADLPSSDRTEIPSIETKPQPQKAVSGPTNNKASPEPQESQIVTIPTRREAPPQESSRLLPRRHPATYQPHSQPGEPASCLLFRPQAGLSLHENRAAVARALNCLHPKPTAVRRIRDGGLAVDFPLDQNLDHLITITEVASIPISVEPPRRRQGSSGVIRGDFSAAEEVFELYSIHAGNPAIRKIEQLGDRKVFRIFFVDTCPSTVTIFFNQLRVEPYFHHPIRCFRCQGFNHRAADCKRPAYCSLCASPDHTHKECQTQSVRCINCGGSHPAVHKTCPHRLFHLSVAKTAASSGITIREARGITSASYADAVKKHPSKQTFRTPASQPTSTASPPTSTANPPTYTASGNMSASINELLKTALSSHLPKAELDALLRAIQLLLP